MVHVQLICSDEHCGEVYEAFGLLSEIEALCCACGCTLHVVRWLGEEAESSHRFVTLLHAA